jgi:hypothetical protein
MKLARLPRWSTTLRKLRGIPRMSLKITIGSLRRGVILVQSLGQLKRRLGRFLSILGQNGKANLIHLEKGKRKTTSPSL